MSTSRTTRSSVIRRFRYRVAVAALAASLALTTGCDEAEAETEVVLMDVTPVSATTNLNLTLVARFDRTSSYQYFNDSLAAFAAGVVAVVDAGGCDIKVYPGFVEANSYRPSAQLPPIVVPPCPAAPEVPRIRMEPAEPSPDVCSPFDQECADKLAQQHSKARADWEAERDAAAAKYEAASRLYEDRLRAIQVAAHADLRRLGELKVARETVGSDIRGAWISAGELLIAEKGRRNLVLVASDLQPDGYQSGGAIPAFTDAGVVIAFFQCDEPQACQATKAELPSLLNARSIQFFTPAQSNLATVLAAEVTR